MEFKGTKTEWEQKPKYERIIIGNNICDVWGFDAKKDKKKEVEMKANALLISKAPEMLEMLKNILLAVENSNIEADVISMEDLAKLINEATKID